MIPPAMPGRGPFLAIAVALLAVAAAIYAPVARYGFVDYDDPAVVTGNPHVNAGLTVADARWAMTGFAVGHWEPLTWWSLQADVSAWGGRPEPMHVENAVLHGVSSVALLGLWTAATGRLGRAAVVAAVFAVHPMHVESVAWLTERRDALSTPLLLAATWAYVRYAAGGPRRWAWYATFLAAYALSLSAKATGMTWPLVLLLLDRWPLRRGAGWARLIGEKVPAAAIAIAAAALAVAAQRAVGAASSVADLTIGQRLGNAAVTTVIYVAKLFVPINLAAFYPHPGDRPAGAVVAAAGLLALATGYAWRQRHRRPYLLVGWAWFVVVLLPTSGIVQSGKQAMADRYAYVPSIGLSVAVVWAVADAGTGPWRAVVAGAAVVAFGVVARRQVGFWRDTEALFAHASAVTDDNAVADVALGNVAAGRGDAAAAADHYRRAVAEQPGDATAAAAYGGFCLAHGDPAAAAALFARAAQLRPAVPAYRVSHARALSELPGRRADAVAECRAALSIDRADPAARAALADLLARPPERQP